jgi:hypothetical protein
MKEYKQNYELIDVSMYVHYASYQPFMNEHMYIAWDMS